MKKSAYTFFHITIFKYVFASQIRECNQAPLNLTLPRSQCHNFRMVFLKPLPSKKILKTTNY